MKKLLIAVALFGFIVGCEKVAPAILSEDKLLELEKHKALLELEDKQKSAERELRREKMLLLAELCKEMLAQKKGTNCNL